VCLDQRWLLCVFIEHSGVFGLHCMHEMLSIFTNVRGVCLSVCLSCSLNRRQRVQCMPRAVCAGSFDAAFAKCLWPLVLLVLTCVKPVSVANWLFSVL